MQRRELGALGPVSALTLGGGGIGAVWGATTREEAVATVREAVAQGITLLDVAPSYGNGEAELVIGEAFDGRLPAGVRVSTKHGLGAPSPAEVEDRLRTSLDESMARLRLQRIDLFFLHGAIVPPDHPLASQGYATPRPLFVEAVRPAFERLVSEGVIGAWGITGIGVPSAVLETIAEEPPPAAVQCIANLLDSPGSMARFAEDPRPREIISAAHARGVGVMGIRAVQAGALTDGFDRALPSDSLDRLDYDRAAPFRELARELGVSAAYLAHRYALTIPGVDTVVLGVKNRQELRECLEAEAAGPLEGSLVERIDAAVRDG
jgi:aryl-alcohol dehydrogenase-like predicted oxidoreductase